MNTQLPILNQKVIKALEALDRPASVLEICRELERQGHEFTGKNTRQDVYVRIGKFQGIRKDAQDHYFLEHWPEVYVEYVGPREGEERFDLNGQRWQFVTVKNSEGALDIGVYSFSEDRCYNYSVWRSAFVGEK